MDPDPDPACFGRSRSVYGSTSWKNLKTPWIWIQILLQLYQIWNFEVFWFCCCHQAWQGASFWKLMLQRVLTRQSSEWCLFKEVAPKLVWIHIKKAGSILIWFHNTALVISDLFVCLFLTLFYCLKCLHWTSLACCKYFRHGNLLDKACPRRPPSWQSMSKEFDMATFLTKLVQEGHLLGKACPRRKPSWQSLSKEVTILANLVGLGKACPRSSAWLCFRLREFVKIWWLEAEFCLIEGFA